MDQISAVKGVGLFSHRTHNLEETMGQLERPLQLTTLSAVSVLRGFCLVLRMTPPILSLLGLKSCLCGSFSELELPSCSHPVRVQLQPQGNTAVFCPQPWFSFPLGHTCHQGQPGAQVREKPWGRLSFHHWQLSRGSVTFWVIIS